MQRERRRDPYPWTWEIPLATGLVVVVVVLIGIQLGRSVANLIAGAGWTWPTAAGETTGLETGLDTGSPIGTAFWTSLPDIVGGDSAAGLPTSAAGLAGRGLLWGSITATELTLLTLTAWAGTYLYLGWGPGRMRGMATVSEAERLLGVTRLRKVAPLVRPDLYDKHAHHADAVPPVHRTAGPDTVTAAGDHDAAGSAMGRGLRNPWLRTERRTKEEK